MEIKGKTKYVDDKRHLALDWRGQDFDAQKYNGIQASLEDLTDPLPANKENCEPLHIDIVTSDAGMDYFWNNVNFFFEEPLEKREYLGVVVTVPAMHLRNQYLTQKYGKNYMCPDIPSKSDAYGYYHDAQSR